jgi:nitrite reductase/ring-hydroxylating ferredoxin subunit
VGGWREHRYAPVTGTVLCRLDEIPEGGCNEVRFGEGDGALSLFVYRGEPGIRAYVNCCPHFSLPLNARPGRFLMLAGAQIMCAYHCAIFRLDDGHCIAGPAEGMGLEEVRVELAGELVRVSPPP